MNIAYRVFQKRTPNFGKYGPILTIFSLLQQEIYDAQKLSYFSHLTFIMLPLYLAKQTLIIIIIFVYFRLTHATKQENGHTQMSFKDTVG